MDPVAPHHQVLGDRFKIIFLRKGKEVGDELAATLQDVRTLVNKLHREDKNFMRTYEVWIYDQRDNKEYSVDKSFKLVEM